MHSSSPPAESSLRRNVRRACDQCRRRTVKCNGEAHCTNCTDTGLRCSYGNRTIQKTSGPKYIAHLENKVESLEAQLRRYSRASIAQDNSQRRDSGSSVEVISHDPLTKVDSALALASNGSDTQYDITGPSSRFSSREYSGVFVDTLCIDPNLSDTRGMSVYRGRTTGVEVTRGLRYLLDSFAGLSIDPASPAAPHSAAKMANALDHQAPLANLPMVSVARSFFTSGPRMRKWIDLAFDRAFVLWHFIDRDKINAYVQRLSEGGMSNQDGQGSDYIALLQIIIALGQRNDSTMATPEPKYSQSEETRGLWHFAAARVLIPLEDCSRSIAALQTVMCMAIYLKSVSAQKAVHTYVSAACHGAHQLGLHDAANHYWLTDKERTIRQRMFISLRIFDSYITGSLGLPRHLRANNVAPSDPTDAPYIASPELLTAANGNVELLEIISDARDSIFFSDAADTGQGSKMINAVRLHELDTTMKCWALKCHVSTRTTDDRPVVSTKANLFLRFSHCFVLLVLYCPFLHHILKPWDQRSPSANSVVSKCVKAAIDVVHLAEAMDLQGILYEAYAFTVDNVVMAAICLLVVELGDPNDALTTRAKACTWRAKALLEKIAIQNCAAARCLDSLSPLYIRALNTVNTFAPSADELLETPIFIPQKFDSKMPVWNYSNDDEYPINNEFTNSNDFPITTAFESQGLSSADVNQMPANTAYDPSGETGYSNNSFDWGFGDFGNEIM